VIPLILLTQKNHSAPRAAVKLGLRVALSSCYYGLGLHALSPRGRVLILMYHRVLSDDELSSPFIQPGMYVSQSSFEQQVRYLRSNYTMLSLPEILTGWRNRSLDASQRYCVLTFDDGWADTFLHAYPVLRRYQIPATVFLTTSYIGTSQWFWADRLTYLIGHVSRTRLSAPQQRELQALAGSVGGLDCRPLLDTALTLPSDHVASLDRLIEAFKQLPADVIEGFLDRFTRITETSFPGRRAFLSWDEVSEMSHHGITFGSHTCTHPILTNTPMRVVDQELQGSLETLRTKPIASIPVFCYPNGSYNATIKACVKEAGYAAAVAVDSSAETTQPPDLFAIRRLGIHQDITRTPALFSLHLSGLVTARRR
jgi:peptidoglycan/xylan/chitin deacetylase (PgdA/CDA1 family)